MMHVMLLKKGFRSPIKLLANPKKADTIKQNKRQVAVWIHSRAQIYDHGSEISSAVISH